MPQISIDIDILVDAFSDALYLNNAADNEYLRGVYEGQRQSALKFLRALYKTDEKAVESLSIMCLQKKFQINAAKTAK
jgi:hypothetical protein